MNIITRYYEGVTSQIQAEIGNINELFIHNGLKGEGNEAVIRELIKKFIPKKYGVDSGVIIDRKGNQSKQCDIIIYDNYYYPEIFSFSNIHLYPVDLVYALIEVKTTLNPSQAKLAIENIKSTKQLDFIKDFFRINPIDPIDFSDEKAVLWQNESTTPPLGLIFAYQSATSNFETLANWFEIENNEKKTLYPSHVFCLDHGIVLTQPEEHPIPLLCPLLKGNTYFTSDKLKVISKNKKKWEEQSGFYYPISKFKKEEILIDQSKILLNFILILTKLLQNKYLSPRIDFRKEYFTNELKTCFTVTNNELKIKMF